MIENVCLDPELITNFLQVIMEESMKAINLTLWIGIIAGFGIGIAVGICLGILLLQRHNKGVLTG